jgi:hypothetical protein
MSLTSPYYFGLIRKYVTMFGYIFDDIRIEKTDSSGNETELVKVPITYGPKDKMLARVEEDPNIQRQDAIQLPLISFEMTSFVYDSNRKVPTMNRQSVTNSANSSVLFSQYVPVPYNINFSLFVYVKNTEDGNKIVEQILPFFTPDWTLTAELIPEMNYTVDIPIILNSIQLSDAYTGDFKNRRALIWELSFTLRGYMYGPVSSPSIIKFTNTNFEIATTNNIINSVGNTLPITSVNIEPGLDVNGNPTSNASISVPVSQIFANSNYGYITQIIDQG